MKFTAIWSQTLSQNVTLRVLLITLCVTTVFLGASTVRLAIREPIIVERGCTSTAAKTGSHKHTPEEIEAFVRAAVPKRFDTKAVDSALFLSAEEQSFRMKEQKDLQSRDISQRVIVNEVAIAGTMVTVDADRIFKASNLRTTVASPVTLELSRIDRSAANPYGLILQRVAQVKAKEESK